ncbi:hypothetical protein EXIGLDRAFT_722606 [Exidia glandulosa HHB12029]|uniref:P-loop containing nucleoside triphosphate hydrolase protein n=1 Tax=Exidia glandulosa HHB12029 TaxID=1314781 RepID=A0A165F8E1_EXIGL|nr:hypothetical protein EXIGLDRAFT_722606 [Exidia glandulosa HHB12029]
MSYPDKHVVLYCYDASREETLINVVEKWMPEVMHYLPDAPFLLVSCKNDLRRDRRGRSTPSINAHAAVECSAKTAFGVRDVFEQAARLGVEHAKLHSMSGRPCRVQ